MAQSNKSVSPLRQRMIEDMTLRKLGLSVSSREFPITATLCSPAEKRQAMIR